MLNTIICENCGAGFKAIVVGRGRRRKSCSKACGYALRSKRAKAQDWRPRFWSKVDRRSSSECWEWQASKDPFGYGVFAMAGSNDLHRAHRVSWMLHNGRKPGRRCVLHQCDNPPCVNPHHLRLGDRAQNARERVERNRQKKGSDNARSKLTESEVKLILSAPGLQKDIAACFGVHQSTISNIRTKKNWGHIPR